MGEWVEKKLSELGVVVGGATPSTKVELNYLNGDIPWITPKDLSGFHGRYIDRGERNITKLGLSSCSTQIMPANSVLFTSRAPIGYIAIAKNPVCTNQGFKSIVPNAETDYLFLYYLLKYNKVKIEALGSGTTFKEVSGTTMKNIVVRIPRYKQDQVKIGRILSSIDDKIEENERINHNLQQQICSIFDKFFIYSYKTTSKDIIKTTLGAFPSDFNMKRLGELPIQVTDYVANGSFAALKENVRLFQERNYAYFIRNTDLKSGSFEVFVDKHSYDFLAKSRLFGGEIIISNVGDVGSVFLCPVLDAPMTLGNNIIMLKPQEEILRFYLFIWFKYSFGQGLIQGIKSGSAQPKFNKTDFKNLPTIVPPKTLLLNFHSLVLPMFETIEKNNLENRKLTCLRDVLLPQLMSGELDVSEVEI